MAFSTIGSFAGRRAAPIFARHTQKRGMALGGHHGPPPVWTGIDKVVRSYFPEDYQLAIAILSFYGGATILYKITSAITSKPKPVEAATVTKVEAPTTGVPGIETAAFEKWVETDAFTNLLENEEQLKSLVESL